MKKIIMFTIVMLSYNSFAGLTPQKYCEKIYTEDGVACEVLNVDFQAPGNTSGAIASIVFLFKRCVNGEFVITLQRINPNVAVPHTYNNSGCLGYSSNI